jgi:hypothetical protein
VLVAGLVVLLETVPGYRRAAARREAAERLREVEGEADDGKPFRARTTAERAASIDTYFTPATGDSPALPSEAGITRLLGESDIVVQWHEPLHWCKVLRKNGMHCRIDKGPRTSQPSLRFNGEHVGVPKGSSDDDLVKILRRHARDTLFSEYYGRRGLKRSDR